MRLKQCRIILESRQKGRKKTGDLHGLIMSLTLRRDENRE